MFRLSRHAGLCLLLPLALLPTLAGAQQTPDASGDVIARIKDEGLNRSHVMQTLSYLTDVIGPRLTGSPNLMRANEWTRDTLTDFGLQNAHLEAWGPFGRGWELERFSAQVTSPQNIPLIAYPKAWSPGFKGTRVGEVVYLDAKTPEDLDKYKGKLKGAIVLTSPIRDIPAHFTSPGSRYTDEELLTMENATAAAGGRRFAGGANGANGAPAGQPPVGGPPNGAPTPNGGRPGAGGPAPALRQQAALVARRLKFCLEEGAILLVDPGTQGDGGTMFVQQAAVPQPTPPAPPATPAAPSANGAPSALPGASTPTTPTTPPAPGATANGSAATRGGGTRRRVAVAARVSPWDKNAPRTVPQIVVAGEQYNRMVRMIQQGETLKMAVDLDVKFYDKDLMAYNTVAEIPGSDLKDQLVMLGGHMDSWHSGTGATDNAAGVAVCMEAVRILETLHLQPRRTIRIALWTGEEEGLYGSAAYVKQHFASRARPANGGGAGAPGAGGGGFGQAALGPLETKPEYEKLSGYFNLDNGTGKIRGIYAQGNDAVRLLFHEWLTPFKDMGANTVTIRNTGSTDHASFDSVGLPGFQFIQDTIEYGSRTHHSNQDVYDRIQADDMKQASIIMAAFVYNTAMRDEMLPRKPLPAPTPTPGATTAAVTTPAPR